MFDHNVKPNFEDGKFIADYLLDLQNAKAVFDKDAVYFYRKRESGTSTLDTSWQKVEKFLMFLSMASCLCSKTIKTA